MSKSKVGSGKLRCSKMQEILRRYKDNLKSKLGELSNDGNLADDILPLWCCISDKYDWNTDKHAPCHLLYYTVGSIIYKKLKNKDSFDSIMEGVHEILGTYLSNNQCKDVPRTKGKELFKLMEDHFPYNLSPKNIWEQEESSGSVSCGRCINYLGKIGETCTKLKNFCTNPQNHSACEDVATGDNQGSPQYVAQLIYSIIPEPRKADELDGNSEAQTSSSVSEGANSSGNIINNISYGFFAIGSLFITFSFYKYISLFFASPRRKSSNGSSVRSHIGGRGRFVTHNLDTRTEDTETGTEYDFSTEYSADYSAATDYSSTVEDFTIRDNHSTVYSFPYTPRTKKEGSSEQEQRKNINNIAYHRM